jgi:hypothetical protein
MNPSRNRLRRPRTWLEIEEYEYLNEKLKKRQRKQVKVLQKRSLNKKNPNACKSKILVRGKNDIEPSVSIAESGPIDPHGFDNVPVPRSQVPICFIIILMFLAIVCTVERCTSSHQVSNKNGAHQ